MPVFNVTLCATQLMTKDVRVVADSEEQLQDNISTIFGMAVDRGWEPDWNTGYIEADHCVDVSEDDNGEGSDFVFQDKGKELVRWENNRISARAKIGDDND
jgi:hypothetical protein